MKTLNLDQVVAQLKKIETEERKLEEDALEGLALIARHRHYQKLIAKACLIFVCRSWVIQKPRLQGVLWLCNVWIRCQTPSAAMFSKKYILDHLLSHIWFKPRAYLEKKNPSYLKKKKS
jgi:hypothetical protein